MKPEREFTLAIGASILATSVGLLTSELALGVNEELFFSLFVLGLLFVLHASGTLQFLLNRLLLYYGRKRSIIGILTDIDINKIGAPRGNINDPSYWKEFLEKKRITIKEIKIGSKITQWSLQRYSVIFNAYGRLYPETDEKKTILELIFEYVARGGVFVNVSDFPFYYAFDINRSTVLNPTPYLDFASPVMVYNWKDFEKVEQGAKPSLFFYQENNFFNYDFIKRTNFLVQPIDSCENSEGLSVTVKLAVLITDRIEPSVLCKGSGVNFSPIFAGRYGNGKFLVSLIPFQGTDEPQHNASEDLVMEKIVEMIGKDREEKEQAMREYMKRHLLDKK